MKLGSLISAIGAFVSHVATATDAATINGEFNKVLPLANQYELHNLEVRASGRIGGVNIEGSYTFTFDDVNTIALGGALGETFPDELRAPVQEALGKFAKSLHPVDSSTVSEDSPWVEESTEESAVETPVETPTEDKAPYQYVNRTFNPLNKGLTLGDMFPTFHSWKR